MFRPSNQRKLKEIAYKNGISLASATEIVRAQWEFVKSVMYSCDLDKGYYPIVGVQHIGKFVVTERRKWCLANIPRPGKKIKHDMC